MVVMEVGEALAVVDWGQLLEDMEDVEPIVMED